MKNAISLFVMIVLLAAIAAPAFAWGPATREAVIMTAVRVLSKEGTVLLSKLERVVLDGAAVSPETLAKLYPDYATNAVRAVEAEMYLLASVRGERVEPYFAYRLGIVGRIAADLTAPLRNENPTYRDHYYADVDKNLRQAPLKTSARHVVDPLPYFERIERLASARDDVITQDYKSGLGFGGVANSALAEDIGRSIDAVADVWSTILTRNVVHASVSDEQLRAYVLNAMAFYIQRGNDAEIDAGYQRLTPLAAKTPDMAKRIGDMFYDAGMFERAIAEYEAVHAAEPQRKDVVEKIANYYIEVGDEALDASRLKQALDAYAKAAAVNPLHPSAEGKRLQAEAMIAERETRLEATRRTIEEAAELQTQSEQRVLQRKFAEAMETLDEARVKYESVSDEFPTESQAASTGISNILSRVRELKGELVQNAQTLSGSSFGFDMQRLAATAAPNLDEQALRALLTNELNQEVNKLRTELQDAATIK